MNYCLRTAFHLLITAQTMLYIGAAEFVTLYSQSVSTYPKHPHTVLRGLEKRYTWRE